MPSFYQPDFQEFESRFRTTFFNSLSGFKSLNILGTKSLEGNSNLGLFNSIFHIGANPPLIGLVIRPEGAEHDTLNNILSTGMYTLNLVPKAIYKNAHKTSARYPSGISEFEPCGLKEVYSENGFGPYVLESPIRIGLKKMEIIEIKLNGTRIVVGEIMEVHLTDEHFISNDGFIDPEKANLISSVGLDAYYLPSLVSRLSYAKPYTEPEELRIEKN